MKMTRIQFLRIKTQASIALISIGVIGLLSTVCAYSFYIPAGDTSYQWLWVWVGFYNIYCMCIISGRVISKRSTFFLSFSDLGAYFNGWY